MTDDTWPDIPAELEQIAEDLSMLWCGGQDAHPNISQVMTIGEAAGQLRAHAVWLRAGRAAHVSQPRVTPLNGVFDLIRQERQIGRAHV